MAPATLIICHGYSTCCYSNWADTFWLEKMWAEIRRSHQEFVKSLCSVLPPPIREKWTLVKTAIPRIIKQPCWRKMRWKSLT